MKRSASPRAKAAASLTDLPRLSPHDLAQSLATTLAHWDGREPLWVFGYGSLIWNPEFEFDRRVPARVYGYHRKLCLRSVRNRGTPECPGLVAGLDRGGSCVGIAYRVPADSVRAQFARLWEREMFMGSYAPRWLHVRRLDDHGSLTALAFVVRRDAPNYCARLGEREVIEALAHARGRYGTSLDYLLRTVEGLRAEGLADPHLERLARRAQRLLVDAPTRR
jgi:cation transport protein ChaC